MSSGWPSEEWVQETAALASVEPTEFDGTVEVVVKAVPTSQGTEPGAGAGSKRGRSGGKAVAETRYHRVFAGGSVVESALGPAPADADVTVTVTEEDARAMLSGGLDPSVAFMRGTLKTSGDPGLLLRLLDGWSTEPARQARINMGKRADLP